MYQTVKRTLLLLCCAMLLVIGNISFAMGMTYYAAPYGNNSNAGTDENSPWPIQTAVDTAVAGDTVLLREGVYFLASTINIRNSGTVQLPITIKAYQYSAIVSGQQTMKSESVMIDAGNPATTMLDSAFYITNLDGRAQHIVIANLEIVGGKRYGIVMDTTGNKIVQSNIHGAGIGQIQYPNATNVYVNLEVTDSSPSVIQPVVSQPATSKTSQTQSVSQNTQSAQAGGQDEGDGGGSQDTSSGGGCTVMSGQTDLSLLLFLLFILLYRQLTQLRNIQVKSRPKQ